MKQEYGKYLPLLKTFDEHFTPERSVQMLIQFTCMCNCLYEQASTVTAFLTLQILGFDIFFLKFQF